MEPEKECFCTLCNGEGVVSVIVIPNPSEPQLHEWDEKPCPECQNNDNN